MLTSIWIWALKTFRFDAEEQVLGRINRSCKKKGAKVFFLTMTLLIFYTATISENRSTSQSKIKPCGACFESKNFTTFYDIILKEINTSKKANNESNIENFARETLWNFDYFELQKHMKLIDDERQEISLFICGAPVEIDGILIDRCCPLG